MAWGSSGEQRSHDTAREPHDGREGGEEEERKEREGEAHGLPL